ncbi:hypothetical protein CYLTODRAFT_494919 [Cylindrobasidium torrendii FP15055 ss-10]|uniref:Mitochondrial import inner membrane translocase subunit TIM50 n=1 Tax=Cylindrobasidium torrendii FP15055 ss-10 TaxID=1314674 RepID=A0A0D7AVZ3_9AGAR|nr:hypothetical protein CYLTODRAFT_494919 [Cylindrobasidium torrendii FP15055 ss-10]
MHPADSEAQRRYSRRYDMYNMYGSGPSSYYTPPQDTYPRTSNSNQYPSYPNDEYTPQQPSYHHDQYWRHNDSNAGYHPQYVQEPAYHDNWNARPNYYPVPRRDDDYFQQQPEWQEWDNRSQSTRRWAESSQYEYSRRSRARSSSPPRQRPLDDYSPHSFDYEPSRQRRDPPRPEPRARYRASKPESVIIPPPSAEYQAQMVEPSEALSRPSDIRKLLVLDLNGTLLNRDDYHKQGLWDNNDWGTYGRGHAVGRPPPRPRTMRKRPYLKSFLRYLFHDDTQAWLDTMVWSSAARGNVDDMVFKAFGDERTNLAAIWARDTLGLTSAQYTGKTQTNKNLEKPWSRCGFDKEAARDTSDPLTPIATTSLHSAKTTILLDDSPLKAQQQPWNQLTIPEYTAQMRRLDEDAEEARRNLEDAKASMLTFSESDAAEAQDALKEAEEESAALDAGLDSTLLAVIGVLDAIKMESSVVAWMYNGGLSLQETSSSSSRSSNETTMANAHIAPPPSSDASPGVSVPMATVEHMAPSSTSLEIGIAAPAAKPDSALLAHQTWFNNAQVVEFRVQLGKAALQRLGIPVEP